MEPISPSAISSPAPSNSLDRVRILSLLALLACGLALSACADEPEPSSEHGIPVADSVVVDSSGPMLQPPAIVDSLTE